MNVFHENKSELSRIPAYADFLLSFSGFCLALFLAVHLVFDATILFGPGVYNNVPLLLHSLYLAQIFTPLVVIGFFAHFLTAVRKIPFRLDNLQKFITVTGSTGHRDTVLWSLQCITGLILLMSGTVHFWTILSPGLENINAVTSSQRAVQMSYHFFYFILMFSAVSHAGIGMYRVTVKWTGRGRKAVFSFMMLISVFYCILSLFSITAFHDRGKMQEVLKIQLIKMENLADNGKDAIPDFEIKHFFNLMKKLQLELKPEIFEDLGLIYNGSVYSSLDNYERERQK